MLEISFDVRLKAAARRAPSCLAWYLSLNKYQSLLHAVLEHLMMCIAWHRVGRDVDVAAVKHHITSGVPMLPTLPKRPVADCFTAS